MTNLYVWLKHTEIYWQHTVESLLFFQEKAIFSYLVQPHTEAPPVLHMNGALPNTQHGNPSSLALQDLFGTRGEASTHMVGFWNGLGHLSQVITNIRKQTITCKERKQRCHKISALICFHLGSCLAYFSTHTDVLYSMGIKHMGQVQLYLVPAIWL